MLGLYVHIPFCSSICNYCNFNRGLFDGELKRRYVSALVAEIRGQAQGLGPVERVAGRPADTIFFGGGTPSLLDAGEVSAILAALGDTFDLATDAEITLEANPETVAVDTLRAFREAGVNRLSFGVQSFRDDELRRLSRLHGAERARGAYREARMAGFDNVSLDLMMWLPSQRCDHWLESVEEAIALGPDHVSLYMLEVYPNAPLRDEMARAAWSQAPDEDVAAMYLDAMSRLDDAGYEQYEISNVARPGCRARHNLKYWTDGEWRGFGCGAHSTVGAVRWKNCAGTDEYVGVVASGQIPVVERRDRTLSERVGDALFTGLRLADGVDVAAVNTRYGVDVWMSYGTELQSFVDLGYLVVTGDRWRLSRPGMLVAHEVMSIFV